VADAARERFDAYKDLLEAFVFSSPMTSHTMSSLPASGVGKAVLMRIAIGKFSLCAIMQSELFVAILSAERSTLNRGMRELSSLLAIGKLGTYCGQDNLIALSERSSTVTG
jgi:hypothetical protein